MVEMGYYPIKWGADATCTLAKLPIKTCIELARIDKSLDEISYRQMSYKEGLVVFSHPLPSEQKRQMRLYDERSEIMKSLGPQEYINVRGAINLGGKGYVTEGELAKQMKAGKVSEVEQLIKK